MNLRSHRLRWTLVPALAVSLLAVGTTGVATAKADKAPRLAPATLNASGATFPLPYQQQAIAEFKKLQKAVTINYAGGGSGKGRQDFADQVVDYAGSDGLYAASALAGIKGGPFAYIPYVAGPITVSFNLPGVKTLSLSPDTIAKIFQRQLTTWDDPAIKADNPNAKLPSTAITVVHRSDSSGTTENFTKFLTKAAPGVWTLGGASTVSWAADTQGGNGNAGVGAAVQKTEGAVGYVDFSDAVAIGLTFASVKNADGKFVVPSLAGTTAALAQTTLNADLTYDPLNATGAKSYPITAPTWMLVYLNQTDAAKGAALKAFLNYVLGAGQKIAASVDYAALPANFIKAAKAKVDSIQVPAS